LNKQNQDFSKKYASIKFDLNLYKKNTICVYPLPEYYKLNAEQQAYLGKQFFSISNQSNRMAYQLNETFENELSGIKSTPVMPGTVQLTPEGKLIILMRDAQVTGGYPRIFQVSASSLNVLAQMSANQSLKFQIKHQFHEI
jgi:allophanate hydrolase subunit 2